MALDFTSFQSHYFEMYFSANMANIELRRGKDMVESGEHVYPAVQQCLIRAQPTLKVCCRIYAAPVIVNCELQLICIYPMSSSHFVVYCGQCVKHLRTGYSNIPLVLLLSVSKFLDNDVFQGPRSLDLGESVLSTNGVIWTVDDL